MPSSAAGWSITNHPWRDSARLYWSWARAVCHACVARCPPRATCAQRGGQAAGRAEEVAGLYARLWAAVDDPQQAMASLLQGKEALAAAALRRALRGALCLGDLGQGPG